MSMSASSSSSQIVLSVRNLTTYLKIKNKAFKVVDDVSFDLKRGQTLAILGESGCGKSMTAFSLINLLPYPPALPPQGEAIYKGKNLLALSEKELRGIRGKDISMIFQNPMTALNPVFTIGDQLLEVVNLHLGLYADEAFEKIIATLEEVGIRDAAQRFFEYPHQLSGGMQQRVMIAMALLCEPDILIADEPTTALDVTIQAQVLELMQELQRKKGMAILMITHDMGVVHKMADEIVVMYAARAVEKAKAKDLFRNMGHPYTKGLFLSLPQVNKQRGKLNTIDGVVPNLANLPDGCPFYDRCPHAKAICKQTLQESQVGLESSHKVLCVLHQAKESTHV